jgi:hypothetical protein
MGGAPAVGVEEVARVETIGGGVANDMWSVRNNGLDAE